MELGQRIRQARQEAGLSQRQLCGDRITRNMLSQIENGSARPSMDTLAYLASRLEKPVGYFLEEQAVTSPNQQRMAQARQAAPEQVLALLQDYRQPDEVFDRERWLLEALACMELAREAIAQRKWGYACTLLERCAAAGEKTPYYTPELERQRLLMLFQADRTLAAQLAAGLPEDAGEALLRAQAALDRKDPALAGRYLQGTTQRTDTWYWLMGQSCMEQQDYGQAVTYLELIQEPSMEVYGALERCCREMEDYKKAYLYACKQRELGVM